MKTNTLQFWLCLRLWVYPFEALTYIKSYAQKNRISTVTYIERPLLLKTDKYVCMNHSSLAR